MVQVCEDIVHVDPLSTTPLSVSETVRRKSKSKRKSSSEFNSTTQITEIYASTKAYPHWWSQVEEDKVSRRRKSAGDGVLERNLCFVDTPGYGNGTSVSLDFGVARHILDSMLTDSVHGMYYTGCRIR